MSDKVSSLYAEIGFKVNKQGITEAKSLLTDFANQIKSLNASAQNQISPFVSTKAEKDAMRAHSQAVKQQLAEDKQKLNEQKANQKASLDLRKQEAKEKIANEKLDIERAKLKRLRDRDAINDERYQKREEEKLKKEQQRQEEKRHREAKKAVKEQHELEERQYREAEKAAKEQQRLEDKQQREAEKAARQRIRRLKRILGGFKEFVFGIGSAFVNLAGIGAAGIAGTLAYTKEARDRAVNVRDFQFETGVGYNDLQRYRRNFTAIGSNMTPEDIMSDLAGVQQNLVDISLGKGHLSGYKLAGVRASAESGSAQRVMESLRQVAQDRSIDNAMLINIMRDMGIKNARDWLLAFRSNIPEDTLKEQTQTTAEQEEDILRAQISIKGFSGALDDLKENITAYISPAMKDLADSWKVSVQTFIKEFNSGGYTDLKDGIKTLAESLGELTKWVGKAAQAYIEVLPTIKKFGETLGEKIAKWTFGEADPGKKLTKAEEQARQTLMRIAEGRTEKTWTAMDVKATGGRSFEDAKAYFDAYKAMQPAESDLSKLLVSGIEDNKIKGFNGDRRIRNVVTYNYTDNHTVNSTVNGIPSEDIADEVIDRINTNDRMRTTKDIGANVNLINGLYVLGSTV